MMKTHPKQLLLAAAIGFLCINTTVKAQSVTGTLQDSINHTLPGLPGDTIYYKAKLKNPSGSNATGVQYNNPTPANTVLQSGTKTSALARNDNFTTVFNTANNSQNVLTNDFGVSSPTVASWGTTANTALHAAGASGSTPGGGTATVASNGALSYSPGTGFTGHDIFAYKATNGNAPDNNATVDIAVGNPATATNDSYNATGNVSITLSAGAGVKTNDFGDAIAVTKVQGLAGNVGVSTNTANSGQVTMQADGSFTYNPPPGFEGNDSFTYAVDNGFNAPATGTVTIAVSGMIWFVNNSGANGDGRLSSPFNSLAGVSNGAGGSAINDNIFIYTGSGDYTGGIVLLSNQRLIGQGASATLSGITGITPPSYSASLPATGGTAPVIVNAAANGVTLNGAATTNTLRGISIHNCSLSALNGGSFGTVFVDPDVSINTTGQAISLSNGAVSGNFGAVSSSGGTNNVSFGTCTGSTSFSGFLSGASSTSFSVIGGSISITKTGDITQTNAALLINVTGHSGTLTFQTGTLAATTLSTGMNFSSANGTYSFNGNNNMSGATKVQITSGSGTFSFSTNTNLSNQTGLEAFNINGGSCNVTFNGNLTQSSGTNPAAIIGGGHVGGTVNFTAQSINLTAGAGLLFNNAGGSYTFSQMNLNGGSAGVDIVNSNGTFTFPFNNTIVSPADTAFNVRGGTASISYAGALTQANNFPIVSVSQGHSTGTITFLTGTIGATNGSGLQFDNADGIYNFNGTANLNGGSAAVNIVNGSGGSFAFASTTSITSPADTAFNVIGGTAAITYSGNITQANNFPMVCVSQGHATGTIQFQSGTLNASNGTGLQFNNADGTYNFNGTTTMNGGNAAIDILNASAGTFNFGSGCSITNPTGEVLLVGSGTANITYSGTFLKNNTNSGFGSIYINANSGGTININGTGTKTLTNTTINAINLTTNPGTTINFSGNNLLLSTTSGIGFNATGGGTVSLTGTGNTISSVGGTALNVNGTTIGASGMTFQSISSSGTSKGISLNTTGSGGLTITGTGTTLGSGGTISNITTRGAEFISASNINLKNMNFTNACTADFPAGPTGLSTGNNTADNAVIHLQTVDNATLDRIIISSSAEQGINGHNVNDFNLTNSSISNAGNSADEDGIHFFNMSGTSNITSTSVTSSGDDNLIIQNNTNLSSISTVSTINISGGSYNTGVLGSGVLFGIRGTFNTTINISGITINNNFSGGVVADCYDNATMDVEVSTCTITNNNDAVAISSNNGNTNFDVHDNSNLSGQDFVNISILKAAFSTGGIMQGKIRNNTITTENGHTTDGIVVFNAGGGTLKFTITNNTMDYAGTQRAINIQGGQDGASTLEGTVTGNNIAIQLDGAGNAVNGVLANSEVADPSGAGSSLCIDIGGAGALANTFTHPLGGTLAGGDIRVRQRFSANVRLPGYGGGSTDVTAVGLYLDGRNNEVSPSTATFLTGTFSGGGACLQPTF